jgi:hypothetical protein
LYSVLENSVIFQHLIWSPNHWFPVYTASLLLTNILYPRPIIAIFPYFTFFFVTNLVAVHRVFKVFVVEFQ